MSHIILDEEEAIKLVYINSLFLLTPVHIHTSHVLGTDKYIILPHSLCTL